VTKSFLVQVCPIKMNVFPKKRIDIELSFLSQFYSFYSRERLVRTTNCFYGQYGI